MPLKTRKKKSAPTLDRKFDTKYLGDEPKWDEKNMPKTESERRATKMSVYQWYNYFYTSKEHRKFILEFAKTELGYTKNQLANLKAAKDWEISVSVEKLIRMALRGWVFDDVERTKVTEELARVEKKMDAIRKAEKKAEKKKGPVVKSVTVNSPILGELDDIEDSFILGEKVEEYKIFERQQIHNDTKHNLEKWVKPWLDQRIEELELHKAGDKEVKEGLNMSARRRNQILKLYTQIRADLETMLATKKKRAPAKRKMSKEQEALKMSKGFKYLKSDSEFSIESIRPTDIIGAKVLYMFNTKNRELHVLTSPDGFGGKGMAITNFDAENSFKIKLRKPEDILPVVLKKTTLQTQRELDKLTTKKGETNGRTNAYMVLLKVAMK